MNETKGMVYQMGQDLKREYELHLGHVGATMAQHQHENKDYSRLWKRKSC